MVKGKPISPSDIPELQLEQIPEHMFDIVNLLIVENITDAGAIVRQEDIMQRFAGDDESLRGRALRYGWLNFEPAYRANGWTVRYEKSDHGGTSNAVFIFTPKQPT